MVTDLPDQYSSGDNVVDTYRYILIIAPGNFAWAGRVIMPITLPIGILRRVQIDFPNGCNGRMMANIYHGANQLFPLDAGGGPGADYYCFNNHILDFNCFELIPPGATAFTLNGWTDGFAEIYWNHSIVIVFYVERVVIP